MQHYIKFLLSTLFKKWSIYISIGLYTLVSLMIFFVIPVAMKINVIQAVQNTTIMVMYILVGAIVGSTIATQLFRDGIDNGSEIIIFSKPITRSNIIWSKLIVLNFLIILISTITMILAFFTGLSKWHAYNTGLMGAGALIASLVILMIFSSIGILASLFLKKVGAILLTTGVSLIMMLYTFIATIVSVAPSTYFSSNGVNVKPVSLLKKQGFIQNQQPVNNVPNTQNNNDDTKQDFSNETALNYNWFALAELNNVILTSQTPSSFDPSSPVTKEPQAYLSTMWRSAIHNKFWLNFQYSDFISQFISLFNLSVNRFFNGAPANYLTTNGGLLQGFLYKFSPVNSQLNQENNDYLLKQNFMGLTVNNTLNTNNPFNPLNPNQQTIKTNYLLSQNYQIEFYFPNLIKSDGLYLTRYGLEKSGNLYINNNIQLQSFTNPADFSSTLVNQTYNANNLESIKTFVNTFYNANVLNYINKLDLSPINNYQKFPSYYATYFFNQILLNNKISNIQNFLKLSNVEQYKLMSIFNNDFYNFQYLTFLALESQKDLNFNNLLDQAMLFNLGLPNEGSSFTFSFLAGKQTLFNNFTLPLNNPLKVDALKYIITYTPPFSLLASLYFQSVNVISPYSIYNVAALVSCWIILSLIFMMIALAIYAKKDFS